MHVHRLALVCGTILVSGGCAQGRPAAAPAPERTVVVRTDDSRASQHPVFIVDGRVIAASEANAIDPAQIVSVNVLKGERAEAEYGHGARDGVVVIVTRRGGGAGGAVAVVPARPENRITLRGSATDGAIVVTPSRPENRVTIRGRVSGGPEPMFMVDGVRIPAGRADTIDPESIENVEVIKGAEAVRRFGEGAREGVVIITTRRAHRILL